MSTTLALKGGRKKPEPKARTEGVCRLKGRRHLYVRIYKAAAARAKYVSTYRADMRSAQALVPTIRAGVARGQTSAEAIRAAHQPNLPIE